MPNSNSSSQDSSPIDLPDKEYLYGEFFKPLRWKQRLEKKLAHKSLDIPMDDDDDMNITQIKKGLDWKDILAMGAGGVCMMMVWQGIKGLAEPPTAPVDPPAATAPHEDRDTTRGIGIRKYVPPAADREAASRDP